MLSGGVDCNDLFGIYRKYNDLRLSIKKIKKYSLFYANVKCDTQVIGINMFGKIPCQIAEYLGLTSAKDYIGHFLRHSFATLLADSGSSILIVNRHGGWKSIAVTEGYVEGSTDCKERKFKCR